MAVATARTTTEKRPYGNDNDGEATLYDDNWMDNDDDNDDDNNNGDSTMTTVGVLDDGDDDGGGEEEEEFDPFDVDSYKRMEDSATWCMGRNILGILNDRRLLGPQRRRNTAAATAAHRGPSLGRGALERGGDPDNGARGGSVVATATGGWRKRAAVAPGKAPTGGGQ